MLLTLYELITFEISEMFSVNSREPSREPCGTPYLQLKFSDCIFPTQTD